MRPSHLDLANDPALESELSSYIADAQEMIEEFLEASWDPSYTGFEPDIIADEPPRGVQNATLRLVGNIIAQARIRRTNGVLSLDEFRQMLMPDEVFTDSIKSDLLPYLGGGRKKREEDRDDKKMGFSMFRVRNKHQIARGR